MEAEAAQEVIVEHTDIENKHKKELTADDLPAINQKLDKGYLVELSKLRDGSLKAKTVMKKEIQLPAAR